MAGVTVLYGSQTGCAESIAQQIYNDALSRQLEAQLLPLNDFQKANIESKPGHHVIIVCSTTGNGEPPDNAGKFWRYVKRRTQPKDMLVNLSFTVLGLGDTNYDRFCYMGKNIDKRFAELGAQRYYPMCAADEALGLEDMVEPWLAGLWAAFDKSYGTTGGDDDATGTSSGSDVGPESEMKSADGKVQDIAAHDDADLRKYLPVNLISYEKMFGPLSGPTQAPDDVPRLQVPMFQTQYQDEQTTVATPATTGVYSEEWSISNPFLGSIVAAKYLTSSESERKVLGLEIDLGNSGIQFKPGDSIGVQCPNRSDEVEALLARLDLDGSKKVIVESTASSGRSSKKAATSSSRFPTSSTVRDLFLQYTDIRSSPKKAVVRALATYCSNVEEQAQMLVLSSKQGASKYKALIEEQQVSFLELLLLFPSCHPPLDHVLSLLPQLMPRYYSIASSPLADSKRVTVAFTVVDYAVGPQGIRRRGLCTNWLQEIAQPLLDGHAQSSGEAAVDVGIKVPVYLRPTRDFQLPADLQSPMVLIGPGTGVAPFIGFLQHRQLQVMDANKNGGDEEVPASTEAGPISLFFGCRRKSEDWIFRNDMESYLANGTLSSLFTAFSRDQAEKRYVQHDLIANGKLVYDLIHEGEGFVFVCGDGVSMARDVHAALVQIVEKHGNLSSEDAEGVLRSLAGAQRYVRDIW